MIPDFDSLAMSTLEDPQYIQFRTTYSSHLHPYCQTTPTYSSQPDAQFLHSILLYHLRNIAYLRLIWCTGIQIILPGQLLPSWTKFLILLSSAMEMCLSTFLECCCRTRPHYLRMISQNQSYAFSSAPQ
jgi:hypothetical protein